MSTANQTAARPLPLDLYRIYEATDPFHPLPYRLGLCLAREARLRDDITSGRRLMRLGALVLETTELTVARAQCQALYL